VGCGGLNAYIYCYSIQPIPASRNFVGHRSPPSVLSQAKIKTAMEAMATRQAPARAAPLLGAGAESEVLGAVVGVEVGVAGVEGVGVLPPLAPLAQSVL
jgi:hypothetical protein